VLALKGTGDHAVAISAHTTPHLTLIC